MIWTSDWDSPFSILKVDAACGEFLLVRSEAVCLADGLKLFQGRSKVIPARWLQ